MDISKISRVLGTTIQKGITEPYTGFSSGVNDSDRVWRSIGLLKDRVDGEERIVLEMLVHDRFPDCVVRVFTESPLSMHYAMRTTDEEILEKIVYDAVRVFESLPGRAVDLSLVTELEKETGIPFEEALSPIPPPFTLDEIPVAG